MSNTSNVDHKGLVKRDFSPEILKWKSHESEILAKAAIIRGTSPWIDIELASCKSADEVLARRSELQAYKKELLAHKDEILKEESLIKTHRKDIQEKADQIGSQLEDKSISIENKTAIMKEAAQIAYQELFEPSDDEILDRVQKKQIEEIERGAKENLNILDSLPHEIAFKHEKYVVDPKSLRTPKRFDPQPQLKLTNIKGFTPLDISTLRPPTLVKSNPIPDEKTSNLPPLPPLDLSFLSPPSEDEQKR